MIEIPDKLWLVWKKKASQCYKTLVMASND